MTGMEEIKRNIVGILFEINRQYRIAPVQRSEERRVGKECGS